MKRLTDVVICLVCLPLAVPLIGVLALLIRLESEGRAFFVQMRVGRARRPFKLLKLRTMVSDFSDNHSQITVADDPRITRLGGVLRRYGLDEVPQLWNVLIGEMSIVGPRPEVPEYVREYLPEWEAVFSVRPGITDAASIVFRHEERLLAEAGEPEQAYRKIIPIKMKLTLRGIANSSLIYDSIILVRTAAVLTGMLSLKGHPAWVEAAARIREESTG